MKKADSEAVRDAVGALHFQHVATDEIARMLAANECGIGYPVEISGRQVRNYCAGYRRIHGERPPKDQGNRTVETIDAVIDRMVALLAREVTAFEGSRRGSMTQARLRIMRDMELNLSRWEKRRSLAAGTLKLRDVGENLRPNTAPPKKESEIAKLARREREARTSEAPMPPEAMAA